MDDLIPRTIAVVAGAFLITLVVLLVGSMVMRAAAIKAREDADSEKESAPND